MKWHLRVVAVQRGIWRPTQLLPVFARVGFFPSLSKVSAMWRETPVTVRLDDLDRICAALGCTVADLLQAESDPGTAVRGLPGPGRRQAVERTLPARPRTAAMDAYRAASRPFDRRPQR